MGRKLPHFLRPVYLFMLKSVFSQESDNTVEMKTTCFLASLVFCLLLVWGFFVKIGLFFECDTIAISTMKKQKSRHSFNRLNKNCCLGVKTPPHILAVEEVTK